MPMEKIALVVDDMKSWRDILKRSLEQYGFRVFTANNYDKAIKLIEKHDFAIAICDARLIDYEEFNLQGLDVFEQIKKKNLSTKTILLSYYPESISYNSQYIEENPPVNADAFMHKVPQNSSFDKEHFYQVIQQLLENRA